MVKTKIKFSPKVINKKDCKGHTIIEIDEELYYKSFAYIMNTLNDLKKLYKKLNDNLNKKQSSIKESSVKEISHKKQNSIKEDIKRLKQIKDPQELKKECKKMYLKYHPDKNKDVKAKYQFGMIRDICTK